MQKLAPPKLPSSQLRFTHAPVKYNFKLFGTISSLNSLAFFSAVLLCVPALWISSVVKPIVQFENMVGITPNNSIENIHYANIRSAPANPLTQYIRFEYTDLNTIRVLLGRAGFQTVSYDRGLYDNPPDWWIKDNNLGSFDFKNCLRKRHIFRTSMAWLDTKHKTCFIESW